MTYLLPVGSRRHGTCFLYYSARPSGITSKDTKFDSVRLLNKQIPDRKLMLNDVAADGHFNDETRNAAGPRIAQCLSLKKSAQNGWQQEWQNDDPD